MIVCLIKLQTSCAIQNKKIVFVFVLFFGVIAEYFRFVNANKKDYKNSNLGVNKRGKYRKIVSYRAFISPLILSLFF